MVLRSSRFALPSSAPTIAHISSKSQKFVSLKLKDVSVPHTHFDTLLNRLTVQQSVLMVCRLEINRDSRKESRTRDVRLRRMIKWMQRQSIAIVNHVIPSHHVLERADVLFEILVDLACLWTADDVNALTPRCVFLIPEAFGRRKCPVRLDLDKEHSTDQLDQKL